MKSSMLAGAAILTLAAAAAQAADSLAPVGVGAAPPPPAVKPVTETLWGVPITDNYRYMEDLTPTTVDWMKAQGAYTRNVMDAIKPLEAVRARVHAYTGSFGFVQNFA